MLDWPTLLTLVLLGFNLFALLFIAQKLRGGALSQLQRTVGQDLSELRAELSREGHQARGEQSLQLKQNRDELSAALKAFESHLGETHHRLGLESAAHLQALRESVDQKLQALREALGAEGLSNRKEQRETLEAFEKTMRLGFDGFSQLLGTQFETMKKGHVDLVQKTDAHLEKMRQTVDEKLHKTLEERLNRSFKQVSEHLVNVQKGLGEMQELANGVGDLKRVLSNVKSRGIIGEVQLGAILEDVLSPDQYLQNARVKSGSRDHVEFAIRLPGKVSDEPVLLPLDAKFPQEDYLRLQNAYESSDPDAVARERKLLEKALMTAASTISSKYINPPVTTDFAIMFLPTEGLYAEVAKTPGLIGRLQSQKKVMVTGPSTLAALLNSLQMGFRTLAIQKRSAEVWTVLAEVKKEFATFGTALVNAQKKIQSADQELSKLITTRSNVMQRKLKKVEHAPDAPEHADLSEVLVEGDSLAS